MISISGCTYCCLLISDLPVMSPWVILSWILWIRTKLYSLLCTSVARAVSPNSLNFTSLTWDARVSCQLYWSIWEHLTAFKTQQNKQTQKTHKKKHKQLYVTRQFSFEDCCYLVGSYAFCFSVNLFLIVYDCSYCHIKLNWGKDTFLLVL